MDTYKILKSIMKKKKMYINVITQWLISVLIIAGDLAVVANIYIPPILPLYTMDNRSTRGIEEQLLQKAVKCQYDNQQDSMTVKCQYDSLLNTMRSWEH